MLDLVPRRRQRPGEDFVSALVHHVQDGDRLSDDEIVTLASSVIAGGTDTTESQLAHGLRLFADHPDKWDRLGDDPALAEQACQEVLRFEPIAPFTARLVREELELAGIVFPVGTVIFVCAATANRDPLTYTDPGRFDMMADRRGAQVVTFGLRALLRRREPGKGRTHRGAGIPGAPDASFDARRRACLRHADRDLHDAQPASSLYPARTRLNPGGSGSPAGQQRPDRLHVPVPGLRRPASPARQRRPGCLDGIQRVGLPGPPAGLAAGPVHLDHRHPRRPQEPGQARSAGAGALHPDPGSTTSCDRRRQASLHILPADSERLTVGPASSVAARRLSGSGCLYDRQPVAAADSSSASPSRVSFTLRPVTTQPRPDRINERRQHLRAGHQARPQAFPDPWHRAA
jgi:hypothetical protein